MVVFKIGGSSLDSLDKKQSILDLLKTFDDKKIVVASAIGRYPSPYATNTLIDLCKNTSKKESDLLISSGEIISSVVLSDFFNSNGLKSIALSPYEFSVKNIDEDLINKLFIDYECIIIPGFVYTIDNVIYTLPRGGSNLSCAYLAARFSKELYIISDICGIYDKDPKCNDVSMIEELTYDDLIKLNKGDEFFSNFAINILKEAKIITYFIKYNCLTKCSVVR